MSVALSFVRSMASLGKRSPREVSDLSADEAVEEPSATVVVTSLSPMKKGKMKEYFEGTVSEGKSSTRIVGFSRKQLSVMEEFKKNRKTAELRDCKIGKGRRGTRPEVMLKTCTQISPSKKPIDVSEVDFVPEIGLKTVEQRPVFDLVTVSAKVVKVYPSEMLDNGFKKQEISLADTSGVLRATIWGEHVDTVQEKKCYKFSSFMVKDYSGKKYLCMRRDFLNIIELIGTIVNTCEEEGDLADYCTLKSAKIVGVVELVSRKMCFRCLGAVEPGSGIPPVVAKCLAENCRITQRYDGCENKRFARLMFKDRDSEVTLTVFGTMLKKLATMLGCDDVDEESLLSSPALNVTYNASDVAIAIEMAELKCSAVETGV